MQIFYLKNKQDKTEKWVEVLHSFKENTNTNKLLVDELHIVLLEIVAQVAKSNNQRWTDTQTFTVQTILFNDLMKT